MFDLEQFIQAIVGHLGQEDQHLAPTWQWLTLWNVALASWDEAPNEQMQYRLAQQLKSEGVDPRLHDGRREQAECLGHFLLTIGQRNCDRRIRALGWLAIGDVARERGLMEESMSAFDEAGSDFLLIHDSVGWARARGGWLISATYAGKVTGDDIRAMARVTQTLEEAQEYVRLASTEQNIGVAYQNLIEYDTALTRFDLGLAALNHQRQLDRRKRHSTRKQPADKPMARWNYEGMLLANKATTLLYMGKIADAEHLFRQARRRFRLVDNRGYSALLQLHLAIIARSQGHLASGLVLVRRAIDQLMEVDLRLNAAWALSNYAEALLSLNRSQEACTAATRAVELLSVLTQSPLDLVDALVLKARTFGAVGEAVLGLECLDAAERLLPEQTTDHAFQSQHPISLERARLLLQLQRCEEALKLTQGILRPKVPNVMEIHRAEAHLVATEASLELGRLAQARIHADEAIRLGEALRVPEIEYNGHVFLAQLARRCGEPVTALKQYDLATRALHSVLDELAFDQRPGFLEEKESVYLEAMTLSMDMGDSVTALVYLERARARGIWRVPSFVSDPTSPTDSASDVLEADLLEYQAKRSAAATLRVGDGGRDQLQRRRLERELRELEERIRNRTEELALHVGRATLPDAATLLTAARASTTLAYGLADNDLVIFVLHHGSIEARRVANGANEIRHLAKGAILAGFEALAQRLRSASTDQAELNRIADVWGRSLRLDLAQLWDLLIAPVDREGLLPPNGEVLTIVPHDVLHALPLAALYDNQHSCYLVERWATQRAPSCLIRARRSGPPDGRVSHEETRRPWDRTMLALGYSNGGELPQSPREAEELATLLGGQALTETDATSAQLRVLGKGSRYLHLSSHGALYETNPNFSHLLLADGPLYGSTVRQLDLSDCELVSLSACETGCGEPCRGDEFVGLVRDFGFAGVGAVLASLWKVEEGLTRDLLHGFYRRVFQEVSADSTPKPQVVLPQALREAQLVMLADHSNHLRSHPYAWGGLALTSFLGAGI